MRKQNRSMKKLSACVLSAAMVLSLAAPFSSLHVNAEGETPVNLAQASGVTASASEVEAGTSYAAKKAIDGVVNRDAAKAEQSRWGTGRHQNIAPVWLKVDLGAKKSFQSFVLAWERTNITKYKIQTSETGADDGEWTTIYTKEGENDISGLDENIHLAEPVEARYVRLYIDGYNGGTNPVWESVSLYEFQIYENEIPKANLPKENYNLEGTAVASNAEDNDHSAQNAIDGNESTRWATNKSDAKEARTLTVTLPASQRVQYFRIIWERTNIEHYKIEVSPDDTENFEKVYESKAAVTSVNEVISLDSPKWVKKIRLTIDRYNGGDNSWPNVSVGEFESYAVKPGQIDEDATPKTVANMLAAPTVNEAGTKLVIPEVPDNFEVEFLADYEQVVGKDGTIYKPLTEKTIKGIYKVTKGEESAEGSQEHTITIPGQHADAGENAKPAVIPELAEWYGKTEAGTFTANGKIIVSASAQDMMPAAKALAEDYEAELGITCAVQQERIRPQEMSSLQKIQRTVLEKKVI